MAKLRKLSAIIMVLTLLVALMGFGQIAVAEEGPADGQHTAEITFVSKDKSKLNFVYLSGLVMNTDLKGISYDKSSNTLTLNNAKLSDGAIHHSLTIANMGEGFHLNIIGDCSLDYLSLESIGYDTGCTITGYGSLTIGYLDISSDGKAMDVIVDNTVDLTIDSAKMGYNNLPAVKVTSKTALTSMESMIKILGYTEKSLSYNETANGSSYSYESTVNKIEITGTKYVKKTTDGKWAYFDGSRLLNDYTGVAGNEYGLWYVKNGYCDFTYTGLAKGDLGWYMVVDGRVDQQFNGIAKNEHGSWFVENGQVQFHYVGPVSIDGHLFQIEKGKVK